MPKAKKQKETLSTLIVAYLRKKDVVESSIFEKQKQKNLRKKGSLRNISLEENNAKSKYTKTNLIQSDCNPFLYCFSVEMKKTDFIYTCRVF